MPLYDFYCKKCEQTFEEISSPQEIPACPNCGGAEVEREVSAPSPLKTGAFPYKVGPVHPMMNRPAKKSPCAGASAGCGSGFS